MDILQCAHGEIKSFQSVLAKQRDTVDVLSDNGEVVEAAAKRTTADHLSLHGVFENGALFDFAFRTGEPFDDTGLRWNIYGTKGEIEITCPTTMPLNMSIATSFKVKGADGKVEDIKLQGGGPSVNVGKIYEGIRTGDKRIVSFDEAVRRQKFLEKLGAYTDTKLTFARDNVGSN